MHDQAPVLILGLFYGALGIARSLGKRGVAVYGIDTEKKPVAAYSKYIHRLHAPKKDEKLRDFLVNFSKQFKKKPVLYVTGDTYILFILKYQKLLSKYFFYPDHFETVQKLVSKVGTARLFNDLKINSPSTRVIKRNTQSLPQGFKSRFPAILKPDYHHVWESEQDIRTYIGPGLRVKYLRDLFELQETVPKLSPFGDMVLQEFVPGPSENCFYYIGYRNKNKGIVASFVARKMRTLPDTMGSETMLQSVWMPDLLRAGDQLLDCLDYVGHAGIDFKYSEDDNSYKVIEINCRFGINDAFMADYGIDLPYVYYSDLQGIDILPERDYAEGIAWYDFERDLDWIREYRRKHSHNVFLFLFQLARGYHAYAYFDPKDPKPVLMQAKKMVARVLSGSLLKNQ